MTSTDLGNTTLMTRTIVVTGSASGIGRATAELLEAQGDDVIRVDLHEGDVTGDLGDLKTVARVAQDISDRTGGVLHGLVANAGVSAPTELSLRINYFGTVALIKALQPLLAKADSPRVSVTSSAATLQHNSPELVNLLLAGDVDGAITLGKELAERGPEIGYANYSSSKRAISRWIRQIAATDEFAGSGIGINAVGPGQVKTAMTQELFSSDEGRKMAAEAMPTPFNGPSEAQNIAAVHVFLLSPANSSMTGQIIFADGGYDVVARGDDIWESV